MAPTDSNFSGKSDSFTEKSIAQGVARSSGIFVRKRRLPQQPAQVQEVLLLPDRSVSVEADHFLMKSEGRIALVYWHLKELINSMYIMVVKYDFNIKTGAI